MNQAHLIEELFNNLKDKIEFDEDVVALFQILKKMLKINKEKSIECWYYIMNHYNLKEMRKEIKFNPLTNLYLLEILNTHNLNFLFKLLGNISFPNKEIIEDAFFNSYKEESGIYQYLKKIIIKKEKEKEMKELKLVINHEMNNKIFFDVTEFLKRIIKYHIKMKDIDIKYLLKITMIPENKKDQALLNTLLIDYI